MADEKAIPGTLGTVARRVLKVSLEAGPDPRVLGPKIYAIFARYNESERLVSSVTGNFLRLTLDVVPLRKRIVSRRPKEERLAVYRTIRQSASTLLDGIVELFRDPNLLAPLLRAREMVLDAERKSEVDADALEMRLQLPLSAGLQTETMMEVVTLISLLSGLADAAIEAEKDERTKYLRGGRPRDVAQSLIVTNCAFAYTHLTGKKAGTSTGSDGEVAEKHFVEFVQSIWSVLFPTEPKISGPMVKKRLREMRDAKLNVGSRVQL